MKTARIEVLRIAGEIIKDDADEVALTQNSTMRVADEANMTLFTVVLAVIDAPARLEECRPPA